MKNIFLSQNAYDRLIQYLSTPDRAVHLLSLCGRTYPPVDTHPDIYYCKMGVTAHAHIFNGNPEEIGAAYPENIRFNAVCLDRYFIHNLKHTSPALIGEARKIGLAFIHVNQGYTKCNCVVVDGNSVITADRGIVSALKKCPDIDVLPISQGFVNLEKFEYGFLGGASGRVGDEIIFNGNMIDHPDHEAIRQFIENRGLRMTYFPDYPLTDIGSILTDF